MMCPFCNKYIPLVSPLYELFISSPPKAEMGLCRAHKPFIVGVLNKPFRGHYGYWVAAAGIQIIVNMNEEITVVNKFKPMNECCVKKYARKKFPLFCRGPWCYAHPFFGGRVYTIKYMMDVSPESFNDVLRRIERLKAFS